MKGTPLRRAPYAAHWRKAEHREFFLSGLRMAAGDMT